MIEFFIQKAVDHFWLETLLRMGLFGYCTLQCVAAIYMIEISATSEIVSVLNFAKPWMWTYNITSFTSPYFLLQLNPFLLQVVLASFFCLIPFFHLYSLSPLHISLFFIHVIFTPPLDQVIWRFQFGQWRVDENFQVGRLWWNGSFDFVRNVGWGGLQSAFGHGWWHSWRGVHQCSQTHDWPSTLCYIRYSHRMMSLLLRWWKSLRRNCDINISRGR